MEVCPGADRVAGVGGSRTEAACGRLRPCCCKVIGHRTLVNGECVGSPGRLGEESGWRMEGESVGCLSARTRAHHN